VVCRGGAFDVQFADISLLLEPGAACAAALDLISARP
jgi:hypothetical protein